MHPSKRQKSSGDSLAVGSEMHHGSRLSEFEEQESDSSLFQTEDGEHIDDEELLERLKAEENWTNRENIPNIGNASTSLTTKKERMTDEEIKGMVKTLQRNPRFQKIGEQKLAHAIRQMESNFQTSKFIVTTTRAKPLPRRVRVPWEPWEVKYLDGVYTYAL